MKTKVLVTGGAGFVGTHLVKRLLEGNNKVNVIDDLSTGKKQNIIDESTFFEGDIRENNLLAEAAKGCEVIFHLAARVELQKSIIDPSDCFSVNVTGTSNVIMETLKQKNRRLIFASSCAVYPLDPKTSLTEDMSNMGDTPYAMSKVMGENMMQFYHKVMGLNYSALRCFNIYGIGQRSDSSYAAVIPKFIDAAKRGKNLQLFGGGFQTRDFIYVDDIVDAYLLMAKSQKVGEFNVGTGNDISIKELAHIVINIVQSKSQIQNMPSKDGDATRSCSNIEKIKFASQFQPQFSLEEGINLILKHNE